MSAGRGLAVSAHGLARHFDGAAVLRGLDLHVPAGQFLAVVGRSGSGKSTLLRLLGGLDRPDAGRVTLGRMACGNPHHPASIPRETGQGSVGVSPQPRSGGRDGASRARIMFQEPRLLPWATVLDNVAIGLGAHPGADGRARAQAGLDRVGLGARGGEWPAALSGGQKSRVALARALVSRPGLLLLDEPLGALDALTRIEMQGLVETTWLQDGFTAVLVTHDVSEAVMLADRLIVIEDGTIALDLTLDLPRRGRRGSADAAALERRVLEHLLGPSHPHAGGAA